MIRYLYIYIALWFTTRITGNAIKIILHAAPCWLRFYQTRSAWSMSQGLTRSIAAVYNIEPADAIFHMREELTLAHDSKCNRRGQHFGHESGFFCTGVIKVGSGIIHTVSNETGHHRASTIYLIARFMGPTWSLPGAHRTQVGPMWATWTLLSRMP